MIKNLEKINFIKRNKIYNGLKFIEKCNNSQKCINKVYIFGSSIRDDCTNESDVDVCLDSDCEMFDRNLLKIYGEFEKVVDNLCDIMILNKASKKFQNQILDNGILVYEY